MAHKSKVKVGEVFSGFQELHAHLEGISPEVAKMQDQAQGKIWGMRGQIKESLQALEEGNFKQADYKAWDCLSLSLGIETKETPLQVRIQQVLTHSPGKLEQSVPNMEAPYVSQALTILGSSFIHRHRLLDAVRFLERAVAVDPTNLFATHQLCDICNKASKHVLEEDIPNWAEEMDREIILGIETSRKLLEARGITQEHIRGGASVAPFQEAGQERTLLLGELETAASLRYKRGRHLVHDKHDMKTGGEMLRESMQHSYTSLALQKFPRSLPQIQRTLGGGLEAGKIKHAAWALTNIGNCHMLIGEYDRSGLAYALALQVKPDFKMAVEKTEQLSRMSPRKRATDVEGDSKRSPKPVKKQEHKTPVVPWSEIAQSLRPIEVRVSLENQGLSLCNPEDVRTQAGLLAATIQDLEVSPSHAQSFIQHADEQQASYWTGLNVGNLPEFSRVAATLEHIAGRGDLFGGDPAGAAHTLIETYESIRADMIMPEDPGQTEELAHEADVLKTLFGKIE